MKKITAGLFISLDGVVEAESAGTASYEEAKAHLLQREPENAAYLRTSA
jgi:hypothetical protein